MVIVKLSSSCTDGPEMVRVDCHSATVSVDADKILNNSSSLNFIYKSYSQYCVYSAYGLLNLYDAYMQCKVRMLQTKDVLNSSVIESVILAAS